MVRVAACRGSGDRLRDGVDFTAAASWILSFANHEVTPLDGATAPLRLVPLRNLLSRLGEPQHGRGSVHITGSKGKGSTAAMIAAMLQGCGLRVGLYTSPHLHTIRERMQLNGVPIPPEEFARLTSLIRPHAEAVDQSGTGRVTTFELLTALAFLHYREQGADWQVIEVGLGGTLDATNVLDEKDLCVFTPIGLEHTQVLGSTVAQIATDKAGILRRGVAAVMALQRESAAEVLRAACSAQQARLVEVANDCQLSRGKVSLDGQELRLRTVAADYRIRLPLIGRFQAENAATAVLSLELLTDRVGGSRLPFTPATAAAGLAAVRWPGRVEVLKRSPLIVVDGAHSPDSARRLAQTIREELPHRAFYLIAGVSADKDLQAIAAAFAPLDPVVFATASHHPRAADAATVGRVFQELGLMVRQAPDVAAAVDAAVAEAGSGDLVLATGSLFVAAEARETVLGLAPAPV